MFNIKKVLHSNSDLILVLIAVGVLSAAASLCVERYHSRIFPEKAEVVSEKIEQSWDITLADKMVKIFIPEWQEEILDQEKIIRQNADDPKKVISAYLKIAELYEKNKKYDKAKVACNKILEAYSDDPLRKKAYLNLASIYEKEKNFEKVRELNAILMREFPDDAETVKAELSTIDSYEKEGRYKMAIEGYRKFLEKYPKTKERDNLLFKIGMIYENEGKYQDAIEEYKKFLNNYPETKQKDFLSFKIGMLYKKLGQEEKANEFYQGINWDKDSVWSENARAEMWLATGKGEAKKKVIYAMRISAPPKIDGYLNDPPWENVDKVTGFTDSYKNTPVSQMTFASTLYDENNLYVAFNCLESNISGLIAKSSEHDKNVWSDDCIEVFLDTNRDYSTYFQLITNPIGTKYDGDGLNKDIWNPKWQAATAIGDKHWNVELAISFKELRTSMPKPGDVWGLNLTRARRAGEVEISNWSFTDGNHHRPEKFGYLVFR